MQKCGVDYDSEEQARAMCNRCVLDQEELFEINDGACGQIICTHMVYVKKEEGVEKEVLEAIIETKPSTKKRKYKANDEEEEQGIMKVTSEIPDDDNSMLILIYHREANFCECVCGYNISATSHKCRIKEKVQMVVSSPCDKSCRTCADWLEHERKSKLCADQWIVEK